MTKPKPKTVAQCWYCDLLVPDDQAHLGPFGHIECAECRAWRKHAAQSFLPGSQEAPRW